MDFDTEHINDDDSLKRDLEEIKRKSETSADFIQQNYYNILFSQDTCIIIANGDVNKEGIIEKANNEIESIFKYKPEEVKGLNISKLMPNLIAKEHDQFIRNYFEIGEKKLLDKTDKKVFALDKDNSIAL
jgi:PAS domain S-box-containing protein